uniref:Uncharacterized protein n=1 Tax=Cacopsylla melanoneura TaxID=428564 RepID=A0A8D8LSZ9_9HEMI
MAVAPVCTCVLLTVLSTSQIIHGYSFPPIIARDPRDHHIYSPPIQYATDLVKNNVFDYSSFFQDYDYQTGTRNPGREYQNKNDYQKQHQIISEELGYPYFTYQNSPNQREIGNQGSQTSENSPKQGLGANQLALPNPLDLQSYNIDQPMNVISNLLGMVPFVGDFFSQQPSRSQQATYDGQSKYNTNANHLQKLISTVHINPKSYQTVPISKPNNPNIPMTANDQIFLQKLILNPALISQLQTLLQAQKQGVPQPSTDSLQTPNAPLNTNFPAMGLTQGTAPPTVPVATVEAPNPSQTLTTPRPTTAPDILSVPSSPKESLSATLTPSGNQLPPALPAGNVALSSSLPAPSPVPAPPLAHLSVANSRTNW